ncbi:MAG: hypothetical protein A2V70_04915 [Planctomycetes bacterium RBG_13_63_9]|nr:MAG: hypothetical protein A2V70_04915 [Planctomycetes bacterium RBG_13_63_9]
MYPAASNKLVWAWLLAGSLLLAGCTSARQWWRNGLKVGPDFRRPAAPVAEKWIDQGNDPKLKDLPADCAHWWTVFEDPMLSELVDAAHQGNLPLKVAAGRIAEARAQRAIAAGNLFAQLQEMTAGYTRSTSSGNTRIGGIPFQFDKAYFQNWTAGFDAAWELDFWGRFRRQLETADANLSAQIANYDDVLVILQAEVAATYVEIRTLQQRLRLARQDARLQERTVQIARDRYELEVGSPLDVEQAKVELADTGAAIPLLETSLRQAQNRLCVLLGTPPQDVQRILGDRRQIPTAPPEVAVGIPAELVRRRPDVRRAEREVAAQCARIGVATSELYPHFSITGTLGFEAVDFHRLFRLDSTIGSIGPSFRWNILNYGRILGGIRAEDARFQQSVLSYQQTVLKASEEVENAIVAFLRDSARLEPLHRGETAANEAFRLSMVQYEEGQLEFDRVLESQRMKIREQDRSADGRGKVALRLIALYKALGGGWQVRCEPAPYEATEPEVPPQEITNPPVAMQGVCPVAMHDALAHRNPPERQSTWTKGDARWGVVHNGRAYLFSTPENAHRFLKEPDRFAPVLDGDDVVALLDQGQRIPGDCAWVGYLDDRIYLFAGQADFERFHREGRRYATQIQRIARANPPWATKSRDCPSRR